MKKTIINKTVVDLRKTPTIRKKVYYKDSEQETQLLWGDAIHIIDNQGDWSLIECESQAYYSASEERWIGYRGWIPSSSYCTVTTAFPISIVSVYQASVYSLPGQGQIEAILSLGSYVRVLASYPGWKKIEFNQKEGFVMDCLLTPFSSRQPERDSLVHSARFFLDSPYHWGGRSAYDPKETSCLTGVDCSGFTSLIYRAHRIEIPRNAHDQYLAGKKIPLAEAKPGDLIFAGTKERFTHVLMATDNKRVIEAAMTPNCTRELSLDQALEERSPELVACCTFFTRN